MLGPEFNGETPARAMWVPLRGAPFVSAGFTGYLPTVSCFCSFLLVRPCFCWFAHGCFCLFLLVLIRPLQSWAMVLMTWMISS